MKEILNIMGRYEVGTIINEYRNTEVIGNDLETMKLWFNKIRERYINSQDHVIIFLFDYDKNTNIEYYDNRDEIL